MLSNQGSIFVSMTRPSSEIKWMWTCSSAKFQTLPVKTEEVPVLDLVSALYSCKNIKDNW